jgi:hypothetical protein
MEICPAFSVWLMKRSLAGTDFAISAPRMQKGEKSRQMLISLKKRGKTRGFAHRAGIVAPR